MERTCKSCGENKSINEYYQTGISKRNGEPIYRHKCRNCMMKNISKWQRDNPDLTIKSIYKWISNNKETHNDYQRNYQKKYKKEHYDPEKNHIKYMKYRYGIIPEKCLI